MILTVTVIFRGNECFFDSVLFLLVACIARYETRTGIYLFFLARLRRTFYCATVVVSRRFKHGTTETNTAVRGARHTLTRSVDENENGKRPRTRTVSEENRQWKKKIK